MIGKTISHYKIVEEIGRGGMGVVYKAEDTNLKRTVAMKFLPLHTISDDEAKARFEYEAQAAASLDHPNICTIHRFDKDDNQSFICMAYIEGQTLGEKIKSGPLSIPEVVDIALQITEGLTEAHERDIVHRDIKPNNIMFTPKGQVKIMDFGLAKLTQRSNLTRTGTTLGTVAYMSPEQAKGGIADNRSDIWSVGVVIYEMLTGMLPFQGEHDHAIMYSIINEEPEQLTLHRDDVPKRLATVIDNCLSKAPEERYQDTAAIAQELKQLQVLKGYETAVVVPRQRKVKDKAKQSPELFVAPKVKYIAVSLAFSLILLVTVVRFFWPQKLESLPLVIADIDNQTDDPKLNAWWEAMTTSIEESRRFQVLSRARMVSLLEQVGYSDIDRINESLGREICRRAGLDLLALPSLQEVNDILILSWIIIVPEKNEIIYTASEEIPAGESLKPAVIALVEKTRRALAESEEEIQAHSRNIHAIPFDSEAIYHYEKGRQFLLKSEMDSALIAFNKAICIDTTYAMAYYHFGRLHRGDDVVIRYQTKKHCEKYINRLSEKEKFLYLAESSNDEEATLLAGLEVYPDDTDMLLEIASIYVSNRPPEYEKSNIYLEKILKTDSRHMPAMKQLAFNYGKIGDRHRVFEIINRIRDVNAAEAEYATGDYYFHIWQDSSYSETTEAYRNRAEKAFLKTLELDSTHTWTLTHLRQMYRVLEDVEKKLKYARWYSRYGRNPYRVVKAFTRAGKIDEAFEIVDEIARNRPQYSWQKTLHLWYLYAEKQQFDKIDSLLQPFIDNTVSPPSFYCDILAKPILEQARKEVFDGLYQNYVKQGRYLEAFEAKNKVQLFYQDAKSGNRLMQSYMQQAWLPVWGWNDHELSWQILKKALPLVPKDWGGNHCAQLVYNYALHGYYDKADSILNMERRSPDPDVMRVVVLAMKGEVDLAEAAADTLSEKGSGFRYAYKMWMYYHLAKCQLNAGRLDKALESANKLQWPGENNFGIPGLIYPSSFNLIGKIHEAKGDTAAAIRSYEELLKIWQNADDDLVLLVDTKERLKALKI